MTFAPLFERTLHGGPQKIFRFANGFGASVIRNEFSYGSADGLWELAVIKFDGDGAKFGLTHETPITDDVLGHLTDQAVEDTLQKISELPVAEVNT